MADVRLSEVTKKWGDAAAVDTISFSARQGSFVALLGPSGCACVTCRNKSAPHA